MKNDDNLENAFGSLNHYSKDYKGMLSIICTYPFINDIHNYPDCIAIKVLRKYLKPLSKKLVKELYEYGDNNFELSFFKTFLRLYPELQNLNTSDIKKYQKEDFETMYQKLISPKENRYLKICEIE